MEEVEGRPRDGDAGGPAELTPAPPPAPAGAGAGAGAPPGRAALWWEVAAVLAVGVVPHVSNAAVLLGHPAPPEPHWADALSLSVSSACVAFVTLYLIARSGEPWSRFGVVRPALADVVFGAALFAVAVFLPVLMPDFLWALGGPARNLFPPPPREPAEYALVLLKYALSTLSEEVVTRAYLIVRLGELLRSRGEAVVVSAALFALYHAYQGAAGVAFAFAIGVTYGFAFLVLGRLWPLVVGHCLYNVWLELAAR